MHLILVINPGSTSTKVGLFEDERCLVKETLRHSVEEVFPEIDREKQASFRQKAVSSFLEDNAIRIESLSAIVVRGGLLKPLSSGTYIVDDKIYNDLIAGKRGWHASNLGSIIALPMAREFNIPVYTVDPVTVDEFKPLARYSGVSGIPRLSMSHALNMKAVARRAAYLLGKEYEEMCFIVVHLGSGISVSAHQRGKMIDVNNANEEGPFSLERSGTLPALALVGLCYSNKYSKSELVKKLVTGSGVYSYLGSKDFTSVLKRIAEGDQKSKEVVEAMAYQVSKEIGAMATTMHGFVDRILLTGGMANSELLVGLIRDRVSFIAPVEAYPGEEELEALAAGAFRVLSGEEEAMIYD